MNAGAVTSVALLWVAAGVSLAGVVKAPMTLRRRLAPFVSAGLTPTERLASTGTLNMWLAFSLRRLVMRIGSETVLNARLERAGIPVTAVAFRTTQAVVGFAALVVAAVVTVVVTLPAAVVFGLLAGLPLVAVWGCEQVLAVLLRQRTDLVVRELPLVIEQLAEVMKNGVGVAEACAQVAVHTHSVVAGDLGRIAREIAHGVRDEVALQAFADRHDIEAIHRIVAVLDAHRHAADLGGLLAEQVRELRLSAHRELLALMQQREQQVWIPVTVATLVPGVLLLGVPFVYTLGVVLG
ncbi:MAG: type II secretion system F family protein [Nitriliruptoraceae bacterium]